jgi:MFS transporter, PHS family, inorganic phosphate transporter
MGVGVAGDHPLSAVIASEFASTRSRGRLMTAVFTAQGWGNLGTTISIVR